MDVNSIKNAVESGKTALGIEFGSTRIKAVLVERIMPPLLLEVMSGKTAT